ncbi:MAG: CPXCG motif-containing cysteine-rich protein [Gammaproteobacteria bacterium]|nr:CPXCG motif-containing cysteine-rich protein [Gammaproteobacteria bacterium]
MNELREILIGCPYCGENVEITVDCSVERQEYIEDCFVCCRPMTLSIICDAGEVDLQVRRDDEC